jgi:hypothetical protein
MSGGLQRVGRDGGSPEPVVAIANNNAEIAVDDEYVYWADATAVMKQALAAGSPIMIVPSSLPGGGTVTGLAVDSVNVYWSTSTGLLLRYPK